MRNDFCVGFILKLKPASWMPLMVSVQEKSKAEKDFPQFTTP
jgi:hypothetical protein